MFNVGILGASGYTGAELLRFLSSHPELRPTVLVADTQAGKRLGEIYPHLSSYAELPLRSLTDATDDLKGCDVVFSALPHGHSFRLLTQLSNRLVVDLSADFRLKDPSLYPTWYKFNHESPERLADWTYGLTEFFRDDIRASSRISNPGCYATAVLLATLPLARRRLIEPEVVITGMSGASGAGRQSRPDLMIGQMFEDVRAYRVGAHQHTAEIEQTLATVSGQQFAVSFTAALLPIARGILVTCSARLASQCSIDDARTALEEAYRGEPFARFQSNQPGTKDTRGSNSAIVSLGFDPRTRRIISTCVIDNLVKGAAGQALQNANLALGFPETLGLTSIGLYP